MAVPQVALGATLGARYFVTELLGSGSMATVYRAHDPRLDLDVALKVLPPQLAADPAFVERFRREGRTLARLKHDHILRLYELEEDEARWLYFLVLEFLTGGTLKDRLGGRAWRLADVVRLLRPVADALDFAHTQEPAVVHRDLKPANIMFDDRGRVVVTDFGLARMFATEDAGNDDRRTWHSFGAGQFVGTPQYAAPEQADGQPGTVASDRYALGVIAYELLVGELPFSASTPLATLHSVARDPVPLPPMRNSGLDRPVERVLLKALAKDPASRFASAAEFVDALASGGQLTLVPAMPDRPHEIVQSAAAVAASTAGAPKAHRLEVDGSPVGAAIRVNGLYRGRMPCTVDVLPTGEHLLEVVADGFAAASLTVSLPSSPVTVHLRPLVAEERRHHVRSFASANSDGARTNKMPHEQGILAGVSHQALRRRIDGTPRRRLVLGGIAAVGLATAAVGAGILATQTLRGYAFPLRGTATPRPSPDRETWPGWQTVTEGVLGGSTPAVSSLSDGRQVVYFLGADRRISRVVQVADTEWSQVKHLGNAPIAGKPIVVRNSDGRLELFARGADDALWHAWQSAVGEASLSDWESLGGKWSTDPAATTSSQGALHVFMVGSDNVLRVRVRVGQTWERAWRPLGDNVMGTPTGGVGIDGQMYVFVRQTDGSLARWWQDTPVTAWIVDGAFGAPVPSNPVARRNLDGRLEVYVTGTDHKLWSRFQNRDGSWSDWRPIGGRLAEAEPAVEQNGDESICVFARWEDGSVRYTWYVPRAGRWAGWQSLGGRSMAGPVTDLDAAGRLTVFVVGPDGILRARRQAVPGGAWEE